MDYFRLQISKYRSLAFRREATADKKVNSHWFHKAIKPDCYSISVRLIADDFQGLKLKTFFQLLMGY